MYYFYTFYAHCDITAAIRFPGPEQSMKIDDQKINRSQSIKLLLISIDWHRPNDDQLIITLRWSRTSSIAIDWH